MLRQYDSGAVSQPPTPPAAGSVGYPTDGSATAGDGTSIGSFWIHSVTEGFCSVIERAGQALSSDVNQFRDALLALIDRPKQFEELAFTPAQSWNVGATPRAILTLTANLTALSLSGDEDGGVYTMLIKQDDTGERTFAFPAGWLWRNQQADSIASGANQQTLLTIRRIGSDIYAAPLLKDMG